MDNYFELFSLPISFEIDKSILTDNYYLLSKQYHPDKFTLASAEEQAEAMSMSTKVNEAYKILKKEPSRIRHVLELLDAAPQEGIDKMPQDFLMEMMDINEAIMEYKMDPSEEMKVKITGEVSAFEAQIKASFLSSTEDFDFQNPEATKLSAVKSFYLKSKYLKRLKENLEDREAEI